MRARQGKHQCWPAQARGKRHGQPTLDQAATNAKSPHSRHDAVLPQRGGVQLVLRPPARGQGRPRRLRRAAGLRTVPRHRRAGGGAAAGGLDDRSRRRGGGGGAGDDRLRRGPASGGAGVVGGGAGGGAVRDGPGQRRARRGHQRDGGRGGALPRPADALLDARRVLVRRDDGGGRRRAGGGRRAWARKRTWRSWPWCGSWSPARVRGPPARRDAGRRPGLRPPVRRAARARRGRLLRAAGGGVGDRLERGLPQRRGGRERGAGGGGAHDLLAVMALGRLAGEGLAERFGAVAVVRAGALLAAGGLGAGARNPTPARGDRRVRPDGRGPGRHVPADRRRRGPGRRRCRGAGDRRRLRRRLRGADGRARRRSGCSRTPRGCARRCSWSWRCAVARRAGALRALGRKR